MSEALYHAALVERARRAFGKGRLAEPKTTATVDNPLCGDRVALDLKVEDGKVAAIGHEVRGCLLCEAAAATIAEHLLGCDGPALKDAIAAVRKLLREGEGDPDWPCLDIFTPVHQAKSRRDCVLLPFEALEKAAAPAF